MPFRCLPTHSSYVIVVGLYKVDMVNSKLKWQAARVCLLFTYGSWKIEKKHEIFYFGLLATLQYIHNKALLYNAYYNFKIGLVEC